MSNSISSTVVKILADNSQYKQDMKEVENIRQNLSGKVSSYDKIEARNTAKLNSLFNKRIEKQKELEQAVKSNASVKNISKIRNELAKLATAEEKVIAVSKKNNAKRAMSFKKMNSEAQQAKGSILSLSTAIKGIGIGSIAGAGFALFNKSINELDAIGKRAEDLNMTSTALYEISNQAKLAGVSAEKLDVGLKTLARTYGTDVKTAMIELSERVEKGTLSLAEANRYFGENALEMIRILKKGKTAINEMFNQNYLDKATLSAEKYKAVMHNLSYSVAPHIYELIGDIGGAVDQIARGEDSITYITRLNAELAEKRKKQEESSVPILTRMDKINKDIAESKKEQAMWVNAISETENKSSKQLYISQLENAKKREQEARKKAKEIKEEYESQIYNVNKIIDAADNELKEAKIKLLGREVALNYEIDKTEKDILNKRKELDKYDKRSLDYADTYAELKQKEIKLLNLKEQYKKNEESKKAKQKAEQDLILKQRQAELKNIELKKQAENKAYIELKKQLFIESSIKNAKTKRQAEEIKAALEILKLQKQYNITAKQALDIYKQKQALTNNKNKNGNENKDLDKIKKATDILERAKKGTVGKRTLEEANAYLKGSKPKDGFKTAMFKDDNKLFNTNKAKRSYTQNKNLIRTINGNVAVKANEKSNENKANKIKLDNVITDTLPKLLNILKKIENATQVTAENIKQ